MTSKSLSFPVKTKLILSGSFLAFCLLAPIQGHAHHTGNDTATGIKAPSAAYVVVAEPIKDGAGLSDKAGAGAQNYVENMGKRALSFLSNTSLSQDQKKAEFRKLLNDSFDMETIGRFALGRYWREASPDQKKEYQRLFRNMIVDVYSKRFEDYKGQKFETRDWRADGTKDAIVTSFIIPQEGPEVQVDWRVRYKNGRYQIVDVIVEGVSMSVTQRSDFSSVIQRGGGDVKVLISYLKEK